MHHNLEMLTIDSLICTIVHPKLMKEESFIIYTASKVKHQANIFSVTVGLLV